MYNNKGITLITLIIYIILVIIIIGILSVISANFRQNINNLDIGTVQDVEFDKLNVQFLKETKTENNTINTSNTTDTKIVFSNGNTYNYVSSEGTVYLNENIVIAKNISQFNFEVLTENDKQKLVVTVQIQGKTRVTEYVVQ